MSWAVRGAVIALFVLVVRVEAAVPVWVSLPLGLLIMGYAMRPLSSQDEQ